MRPERFLPALLVSGLALSAPPFVQKTLPNGLTVVISENHSQPLVTIEIAAKNGSMTESPEYNGLSHLYEHMFFKANAALASQEAFMARGRELGLEWNGTTNTERVNYFFTTTSKHFAEAMVFMRDAVVGPKFDAKEFEKERVVVTGEIDRNLSNPYFHLFHEANQRLWWKYPTRKDPLGTRATVLAATPEMMRTIQKRYYVPNNSILVVTGDVKSDEVLTTAATLYAGWQRAEDPFVKFPLVVHPPLPKTEVVLVEQPVRTLTASFNWHGPSTEGPDVASTYAADLLGYALAQPSSKFQKALVDSGACVNARFNWQTQRNVGPVTLFVTAAPEKGEACLGLALAELPKMREQDYLSDEEMKNAVLALRVDFAKQREQPSTYASALTFWWASAGLDYYRSYEENVAKATRADVARYLDAYVLGKPYVVGVMVSPATAQAVIGRAQVEALVAKAASAPASVEAAVPAPAAVDGDVTAYDVNGLEVLVKSVPGAEFVAASLVVRGGVANWTRAESGVESLALEAAATGGTDRLDKDAFARRLETMGSTISSFSTNDFGALSVKSLKGSFASTLDLLADAFLRPALPASEIDLVKQRMLTGLKRQLENPDGALALLAEKALFTGHPYEKRSAGTLESVAGLTREGAVRHLETLRASSRLLLVVAGDVDPSDVARRARAAFGALPRGSFRAEPPAPPSFAKPGFVTEKRPLETNYVANVFPVPHAGARDYPAARVAMDLLSYRLFEEVRTKRNLSYAPYAALNNGAVSYGELYVSAVDPKATLKVMASEVERLKSKRATPKELTDTKEQYLSALFNRTQTTDAQVLFLTAWRVYAGDFREARRIPDRIRAVTPEEVQAFARKYLVNMQTAFVGDPAKLPAEGPPMP
jgi:zinc protease